jgi:hypothetical protein
MACCRTMSISAWDWSSEGLAMRRVATGSLDKAKTCFSVYLTGLAPL